MRHLSLFFHHLSAGPCCQFLAFLVDMDTPMWKLTQLEKRFKDYLRTNPKQFSVDGSSVLFRDTSSGNHLKLAFYTVCWRKVWPFGRSAVLLTHLFFLRLSASSATSHQLC